MSNSKNTTNGASWKRRSVSAAAAAAMAFTALSAAPAGASEVADEEAAYGWYFEQREEAPVTHEIVWEIDDEIDFGPLPMMSFGGGWA